MNLTKLPLTPELAALLAAASDKPQTFTPLPPEPEPEPQHLVEPVHHPDTRKISTGDLVGLNFVGPMAREE